MFIVNCRSDIDLNTPHLRGCEILVIDSDASIDSDDCLENYEEEEEEDEKEEKSY